MSLSRSEQMARISGKNTDPELLLRSALWRSGLRYRIHNRSILGRPDLSFPSQHVAVFVDGCFWHGCPYHYVRPRTKQEFWADKLRLNVERDRRQTLALEAQSWRVVRIWEHAIFEHLAESTSQVFRALSAESWSHDNDWRVTLVEDGENRGQERWHLQSLRQPGLARLETRLRSTRKWRLSSH